MFNSMNLLTCVVEHITPVVAMKYLSMNSENPRKKINTWAIKAYAEDMKAGRWVLNGEPICFDENGNLKDGQHRLHAIIEAGVAVDILVVRNVATECDLYDYGIKRSVSQELKLSNTAESVASAIVTNGVASGSSIPRMLLRDYLVEHGDIIQQAYRISANGNGKGRCRKRDIVLGIYILLRDGMDEESLLTFCKIVNVGLPIDGYECSAPLAFRTKLEVWNNSRRRSNILLNLEYFLRAFNDFKSGTKRTIKYRVKSTDYAEQLFDGIRAKDGLK